MTPGTKIGDFEILDRLGVGGMGEVYRARDTRLGRDVAIKILPPAVAVEPGRLDRLSREARLLASLNHPNIASIHGIETTPSGHALVLELVEGETLGARIRRKRPSIPEVRAIARQIITALDAAHECGIIHRDLKPENVMVGQRGLVKVLDFGIAKESASIAAGDTPTVTVGPTADGVVVGTVAYMSPEQARGLRVDRRTDIWAFGCVLYEMLTGRRAFGGGTLSDTIVATLDKEPDWSALPRDTPPGLRRLLARTLQKDPHDRLRDVADGLADLDETVTAVQSASPLRPGWIRWTGAAIALVVSGWLLTRTNSSPVDPIVHTVLTPLTRDAGLTTSPALSKDGQLLAYASDRAGGGTLDIWVQRVAGGTTLRLTDDEADDTAPDFSPDGSQIVFQSDRGGGGAYVVSAFGGSPPRAVARGARQPRFSPDGSRIAYWSGAWRGGALNTATAIFVVSLAGGEPRRLAPGFTSARAPVWAPDGTSLLFLGRRDDSAAVEETFDWWWAKLDGSPPVKAGLFTDPDLRLAQAEPSAWTSDGVLFSDSRDVWSVPVSQSNGRLLGPPRRLTVSTGAYGSPAGGHEGRIVFASTQNLRVIERAAFDSSERPRPAVQLYSDFAVEVGRPSETRDGTAIVFERPAVNGIEIWTRNLRTTVEQMITRVESTSLVLSATIAPDGARIAYNVDTGGGRGGRGYIVETARGVPLQVCETCVVHGFLSDGRRLLISDGSAIRVHDVVSGNAFDAVTAPDAGLNRPHASPDDRWLAFRKNTGRGEGGKSFIVPLTPGTPPPRESWRAIIEPTTSGRPAGWSLDSRMVYLLLDTDGFRCLWGQRVGMAGELEGTPIPVRHFHAADYASLSTSYGNAVSPDGFLYATIRSRGNIWSLMRKPEAGRE
jgi:serine/threonine protein kinase/Tol biopolymer transport system component